MSQTAAPGVIYDTPSFWISDGSAWDNDEAITFGLTLSDPCQQDLHFTPRAVEGTEEGAAKSTSSVRPLTSELKRNRTKPLTTPTGELG